MTPPIAAADTMTTAAAGAAMTAGEAAAPPAGAGPRILPPLSLEGHLEALQRELDRVREELDVLRRRDDTMQFSMRRLDEELRLAARVQQDFLPKSLPQIGPVRFHTLFRPAAHVSGDLYDVMRLDEAHVGFYMADAVGHGMPAALLTMFLKQALVTKVIDESGYRLLSPAQTMSRLNDALVAQNLSQATFATAIYGRVHTRTLQLTFARGGHPDPILLTRDGGLKPLTADGALLGIFPGDEFEQATVQLEPGDRVFVCSDGIELAFSEGDSPEPDRWRQELLARRDVPTDRLLAELREHLQRTDSPARKKDDLTIIAIDVAR